MSRKYTELPMRCEKSIRDAELKRKIQKSYKYVSKKQFIFLKLCKTTQT